MKTGLLALALAIALLPVWLSANPFVRGAAPGATPAIAAPPMLGGAILGRISDVQRQLNARIAALARQARETPTAGPVLLALLTAFLYGMLHVVGPGHGKTFMLSYFLGEEPRIGRGLLFGALISLLDSVSSFVLVSALYILFRVALPAEATEGAMGILRPASYLLITAFGVWHLVSHLGHRHAHGHVRKEGAGKEASAPVGDERRRSLLPLAVSIGLLPCPISIILLIFGLSIGAYGFGVLLTVFLSLGATIALSLVAFAGMALRGGALAIAGPRPHVHAGVARGLEIGGSSVIVVFGLVLLLSVI